METHSFYEKLKEAALANGISVREDKFKLVFVFSDDYDEMYFDFDDSDILKKVVADGESAVIEDTINRFLAMDRSRKKVIGAFERRIGELGGTIEKYNSQWDVETKHGYGGEARLYYVLTEKIRNLGEKAVLRKLLQEGWIEMYPKEEDLSRLLGLKSGNGPVERLQPEDPADVPLTGALKGLADFFAQGFENAADEGKISQAMKSDFSEKAVNAIGKLEEFAEELRKSFEDEDEGEAYHYADDELDDSGDRLEELFREYQETIKLPDIDEFQFPSEKRYGEFDIWALERLTEIRKRLNFKFRKSPATYYESADWYADEKDWRNHAAETLKKHPGYWGSDIGTYMLKHGDDEDRKNGLEWVKDWLKEGGYDFDCFAETVSFFRNELPELDVYFEPEEIGSDYEMICAFKSGTRGLEKVIRDSVLKTEEAFDGLRLLGHSKLCREDIERIFTQAELEPVREACNKWAGTRNEDELKLWHSKVLKVSLKLGWPEIQRKLSKNYFLSHILWSILADAKTFKNATRKTLIAFRSHLLKTEEPDKQSCLDRFNSLLRYIESQNELVSFFEEEDFLLWTVRPEHYEFIRPLYALRIGQIVDRIPINPLVKNKDYLAIGWSRLRKKEMKALNPEWIET